MVVERFANNAQTTLNGAINSGQTSFDVTDASVLPTLTGGDQFRIRVDDEQMIVTGVSGNTLTVTRNAEGTTNVSHNDGATVTHNLSAGGLTNALVSNAGAVSQSYIGYDTVGGSTETVTTKRQYFKQVTLANDGFLGSIGAYVQQNTTTSTIQVGVGVYTDNSGAPDLLIAVCKGAGDPVGFLTGGAGATGWLEVPVGVWLTAGTYWIAIQFEMSAATFYLYYDGGGSDRYNTPTNFYMAGPAIHSTTTSSNRYSIRGSVLS